MAKLSLRLLQHDFGFEASDPSGIRVRYDNSPEGGGQGFGISPMQALLMSLGSCSGIDVALILKRQRQQIELFEIEVEGYRDEHKVPALWKKVQMVFRLGGDIDVVKAKRAIALSINNYCPVALTLQKAGCEISWELKLNE